MSNQTQQFLDWFFDDLIQDEGHHFYLWCHPSKRTKFFGDTSEGSKYAIAQAKKQNVYFCVGTTKTPPKSGRGTIETIDAVPCMWADIDFGSVGEHHKRANLPPNEAEARKILSKLGVEPSIVVHSGHGLQAFWLFDEPWTFDTEAERHEAIKFARAWNMTLRTVAKGIGYDCDPVSDLTRVMRVPGTVNRKGEPVPVRLMEPNYGEPRRFSRDHLDMFLVAEEYWPGGATSGEARTVIESVDCVIPDPKSGISNKIQGMITNDPKFKKTWERKRTDLSDTSASGYDLSLANCMVAAGCTDQDVADAILARRILHNENPEKGQRRDYLMRTIGKARNAQGAVQSLNRIEEMSQSTALTESELEDKRAEAMKQIARGLGMGIKRFVKHGRENSLYSIELNDGTDVYIGRINMLMSQDLFRCKLADATGVVIKVVKKPAWHNVVSLLLQIADLVENDESSRRAKIVEWLRLYVTGRGSVVFTEENWKDALINGDPFERNDNIHVHAEEFAKFLKFESVERVEKDDLFDMLRLIGFKGKQVSARVDGNTKPTGRYYWYGPKSTLDQVEGDEDSGGVSTA